MTIGLPRALLYHRYQEQWRSFFTELGCQVVESGESDLGLLEAGRREAIDESCLPVKLFLGHLRALEGRCDYIFAPRMKSFGRNEELCVSFHGLYDLAAGVCGTERLLRFNLDAAAGRSELSCYLGMGMQLERDPVHVLRAYRIAKRRQRQTDIAAQASQAREAARPGLKILVAGQPYVSHDRCLSGPLIGMLRELNAVPLFTDRCIRRGSARRAAELTPGLYWTLNREQSGAIAAHRSRVDGIVLLTAFPCGPDSLVNELIVRRVKDVPVLRLTLDGQEGEAGLRTRIESFVDVLTERRRRHVP